MSITILERFKRLAGQTRYCNCESSKCAHTAHVNGSQDPGVCTLNATVVALLPNGERVQLCNACLRAAGWR